MRKQNESEKPGERKAATPAGEKGPLGPEAEAKKEPAPEKKPDPTKAEPPADDEKPAEEPEKAPDDGEAEENGESVEPDPGREKAGGEEPPEEKPKDEATPPESDPEEKAGNEPIPAAPGEDPEKAKLQAELLAARSQLAAYAAGVAPEMIADAVTLATAEAQAAGGTGEEAVAKAMQAVLKRHPEWKAEDGKKKTGGFKLGADPDKAGGKKQGGAPKNGKRWNRFK